MNILSLNAGSSTLKYKLFSMPGEAVLGEGGLDHSGGDGIAKAAEAAVDECRKQGIDAVGHRMVHGGRLFTEPTRLDSAMVPKLRELEDLDPLHNPTEVAMIAAGLRALPDTPAVAVFDTAFHESMPEVAWRYALPYDEADALGLRRYGFHGISYQFVVSVLCDRIGEQACRRTVACHLGNGASVCAIVDGKSVDTSMGMTPVEGLVMGTRSGDVDPGLLMYLMRCTKMRPDQVDELLNHRSGLLGVSGCCSDVRELEQEARAGNSRANLALDLFAYRVCRYVGAYAAAMGGLDALAFTGGIGQHSHSMRARICERLQFLGVELDAGRNEAADSSTRSIGANHGRIPVWVVATDEERQIARETFALLGR